MSELSEAEVRRWASELHCPWCHRGPFRMLAAHTFQAHGITAQALRDAGGYRKSDPLCAADLSRRRAEMADVQNLGEARQTSPPKARKPSVAEQRRRAAFAKSEEIHAKSLASRLANYRPQEVCRSGRHLRTPENLVMTGGSMTCRLCRAETIKRNNAARYRARTPEAGNA